jgi:hypothetical protein
MCAYRFLPAAAWLALAAIAQPQDGPAKLLLPHPVHVRGVVVDGEGAPIPDVRIDHIALTSVFATADSSGNFEFEAKGPAVVFRKKGWTSRLVRVLSSPGDISVVLDRAGDPAPLPSCSKKSGCVAGASFCLPRTRGIGITDSPFSVDVVGREFTIHSWFGPDKTMTLGFGGPSYGGPEPPVQVIWMSGDFSETEREAYGQTVLDARGKTSDGKLWRSIGRLGESASYYGQDPRDATLFDRVLDGLCILVPDR